MKTTVKTSRKYQYLPIVLIAVLVIGSVAASARAQSNYYGQSLRGPVPASVLLLIPDNFDRMTYTSLVGGRETVHYFGRDAAEELRRMLRPAFQDLAVRRVSSEAEAMDMLSHDNPRNAELLGFDYVAVPHFNDVNSRPAGFRYRFEINMVLDLYASDGSKVTSVRGYGESNTGDWSITNPLEAGHVALRMSAEAIRDGIEGRRSLFAVLPRPRYAEAPAPRHPFETDGATDDMDFGSAEASPIPVRVLLLIPDEFSRYVYTSHSRGVETEHFLGEHAEERFRKMLKPQFEHLAFRSVPSEAVAMDMLSSNNPDHSEVKGFDYVAIPKFSKVNAWSERSNYGVEIDMVLNFYSADGSKEIKFTGYGNYISGLLGRVEAVKAKAGDLALNSAVKAIRESIDRRRDAFVS